MDEWSWSNTGKKYIYHIVVKNKIYIGQSKADKAGSRLHHRLQAPFSVSKGDLETAGDKYDVWDLGKDIRNCGLKGTQATYYTEADNYGIPQALIDAFKKKYINANTNAPMEDIDVAEILHILYYQTRSSYTLYNKSMGGQLQSITDARKKRNREKVLTKFNNPQEAAAVLLSSNAKRDQLVAFRDLMDKIWFNDKDWQAFISVNPNASTSFPPEVNYNIYQGFEYALNKTLNQINDILDYEIFSKTLKTNLQNWVRLKVDCINKIFPNFVNRTNSKLFNDIDIQKAANQMIEGITNYVLGATLKSITNTRTYKQQKITSIKVGVNKGNIKTKLMYIMNKLTIIVRPTVFMSPGHRSNAQSSAWITLFYGWKPMKERIVPEIAKQKIVYDFFRNTVNRIENQSFYDDYTIFNKTGEKPAGLNKLFVQFKSDDSKRKFVVRFAATKKEILSSQLKETFNLAKVKFITNSWREFYQMTMSLYIYKKYRGWLYDEETELYYRKNLKYKDYYIGYGFKNNEYINNITSPSQLTIY